MVSETCPPSNTRTGRPIHDRMACITDSPLGARAPGEIAAAAQVMLQSLGIWDKIAGDAQAMTEMVVSDSRSPRDGKFLERVGSYNPMLSKDSATPRVVLKADRISEWLAKGAQPTDRVARFLESAGVIAKTVRANPKAAVPGKQMAERAAKKAARNAILRISAPVNSKRSAKKSKSKA